MATPAEIAEARYGRDVLLPNLGEEVQVTASGDWPTEAGRPNLLRAQRRRATVSPGTLVHRPIYGGGLVLALEGADSQTRRALLSNRIRASALQDPRIEEAVVGVSDGDSTEQVLVDLTVTPRGEDESETVTAALEV